MPTQLLIAMRAKRPFRKVGPPMALVAIVVGTLWARGNYTPALAVLALACFVLVVAWLRAFGTLEDRLAANELALLHDPLTELPNRLLFHDRVHQAILGATRTGTRAAVIVLDVDRFKDVNEALGPHMGDLLLYELGYRLTETLRQSDSVARLGGDEFGILLPEVESEDDALAAANKIRTALATPIAVRDLSLEVEASAGIALYPDHGLDPESLLQAADVAMYNAKRSQAGCELYAGARHEFSPDRLRLVQDLRRAIANGELELHYQPKLRLSDNRVVGVEALARWNHPEQGLIPPDIFIPLAEHTGLIRPLTLGVLEMALDQLAAWRSNGVELGMAVNLSPRNLTDHELPHRIKRLLEERDVPTTWLELEVSEDTIAADPERARDVLARLDAMGIWLAIDDFGAGLSLAYVNQLPVTTLKIDRSFVSAMDENEEHAMVARSTISLGRNLGLRVVAEGVETESALGELRRLGCDLAQGYFFSKPMPAGELERWMQDRGLTEVAA